MSKIIPIMLLFFFISGSFVVIFNPVSATGLIVDSWYEKTPMSTPRWGMGVIDVDGKIYAIGGSIADAPLSNTSCVGTNEQYNPVTDTWITLKPMPTPRMTFVIAVYEGKIYCMGGIIGVTLEPPPLGLSYHGAGDYVTCDIIEIYDPTTDNWSTKASSFPIRTSLFVSSQAQIVDGQFFVISGGNVFVYEPYKDSWTTKTSKNLSDLSYCTVVVNGQIYCLYDEIGVVDTFDGSFDTFDLAWYQKIIIYNPKKDVWSEAKTGPSGGSTTFDVGATTGVYAPQKVYVLKHTGEGDANNWTFTGVYDTFNDKWTTANPLPVAIGNWDVVIIDDVLYAIGTSLTYQYIPIGYHGVLLSGTKFSLNNTAIAVVVLTLAVGIAGGLFFYFRKKAQKITKSNMP